jgi:hypothetical protein
MHTKARFRARALLGGLLALAIGGCGPAVEGQLVVTGTILGDATLEPQTCAGASWGDHTTAIVYDEAEPHWEIEVARQGNVDDVNLMLFGRSMAIGACDRFAVDLHTDWEDGEVRGRLDMSCSLLAGGHIEGEIFFRRCY